MKHAYHVEKIAVQQGAISCIRPNALANTLKKISLIITTKNFCVVLWRMFSTVGDIINTVKGALNCGDIISIVKEIPKVLVVSLHSPEYPPQY